MDRIQAIDVEIATNFVLVELAEAMLRFPPIASPHEGLAVIEEEVDELKKEVRANKRLPDEYMTAMQIEAIQVAAMAIRFVVDLTLSAEPT